MTSTASTFVVRDQVSPLSLEYSIYLWFAVGANDKYLKYTLPSSRASIVK